MVLWFLKDDIGGAIDRDEAMFEFVKNVRRIMYNHNNNILMEVALGAIKKSGLFSGPLVFKVFVEMWPSP